jgi:hypothetical protein
LARPTLASEIQALRDEFAERLREKDEEISRLKNCIADLAEMITQKNLNPKPQFNDVELKVQHGLAIIL